MISELRLLYALEFRLQYYVPSRNWETSMMVRQGDFMSLIHVLTLYKLVRNIQGPLGCRRFQESQSSFKCTLKVNIRLSHESGPQKLLSAPCSEYMIMFERGLLNQSPIGVSTFRVIQMPIREGLSLPSREGYTVCVQSFAPSSNYHMCWTVCVDLVASWV